MDILPKKCSVLLHFDNSNIDDEVTDNVWRVVGNPSINTTNAKFGGKAVQLNGSNYLQCTSGITFGGRDFTIDGWHNINQNSGVAGRIFAIFDEWNSEGLANYRIYYSKFGTNTSNTLGIYICNHRVIYTSRLNYSYQTNIVGCNQLMHFAFVYTHDNRVVKFYKNGVLSLTVSALMLRHTYKTLWFSKNEWAKYGTYNEGPGILSLDEFRILDGVALWTSNFTPPTQKYTLEEFNNTYVNIEKNDGETFGD